ncbi:hypothetical protein GCM10011403_04440 [Pseudohongiella nitratireducens]|uniref:DUF484 family protein n=1 Tax=Pseudohongiella nitratireducens TaxID=1768907 RepID=A0A917GL58_9GAMM|nr:DUF484 family protein [Pseudohongiella nitratireducens]MDF1623679.1 DUF484 family protein [Pseudohongiella nitratireducens]GGG50405.1 hypothetical protein GCM10011403_04440 [Pseudohongiella nitratireducens]
MANSDSNSSISASAIADYLKENPDFFADKDDLLADMTVPHESGRAVSLLERQVKILRERTIESRHTLNSLLENARYNDQLFNVTRHLILLLLEETHPKGLISVTESNLVTQPGIDACRLILVDTPQVATNMQNRFPSLFRSKQVLAEQLDKETSRFLFPATLNPLRSAALCPITYQNSLLAILAIGNQSQNYFNEDLDTLFLDFITEVLGTLLHRMDTAS